MALTAELALCGVQNSLREILVEVLRGNGYKTRAKRMSLAMSIEALKTYFPNSKKKFNAFNESLRIIDSFQDWIHVCRIHITPDLNKIYEPVRPEIIRTVKRILKPFRNINVYR